MSNNILYILVLLTLIKYLDGIQAFDIVGLCAALGVTAMGGLLAKLAHDSIKKMPPLSTLRKLFGYRRDNNTLKVDDGAKAYEELPDRGIDSVRYKFVNGSTISFSLKGIRSKYKRKEEFIDECVSGHGHLTNSGDIKIDTLYDVLDSVWQKAHYNQ